MPNFGILQVDVILILTPKNLILLFNCQNDIPRLAISMGPFWQNENITLHCKKVLRNTANYRCITRNPAHIFIFPWNIAVFFIFTVVYRHLPRNFSEIVRDACTCSITLYTAIVFFSLPRNLAIFGAIL